MREKYESLSLAVLKDLAKARGMRGISALKKSEVVEAMLAQDEKDKQAAAAAAAAAEAAQESVPAGEAAQRRTPAGDAPQRRRSSGDAAQGRRPAGEAAQRRRPAARPAQEKRPAADQPQERTPAGETAQWSALGAESAERAAAPDYPERAYNADRQGGADRAYNTDRQSGADRTYNTDRQSGTDRTYNTDRQSGADRTYNTDRQSGTDRTYNTDRQSGADRAYAADRQNLDRENRDKPPIELSQLDSGQIATGILEVMQDGFGFIRSANYLPGDNDVYVSPSQIRKFNLKTGDVISGNTRIKAQQEKFSALLYLRAINGKSPSEAMKRYNFEDMTPIFPNERMRMERGSRAIAMRIVDLFSPIGLGQRGMIVSPPKAGKTTLLKDIARSILLNDPEMRLLILLIDERPEEVTDIKEAICGENVEVIYSTFDELPEHHKRVSEMVIERAKRLVEQNENVTILLDSITRLARAYNLTVPPSGRTLSGGLDPAALHMPKRFFGAARKMREGGSLTILATALVDTGSKMDDVVYEEFKGTGNMELVLDRKLSERRVFPAIDIPKSGTRREDLLLDREEQEAIYIMRRALNGVKSEEAVENILNMFVHTKDNRELVQRVRRQKFV